jgi:hypothetical protein
MKVDIWTALTTRDASGGIWQQVEISPQPAGDFNLWQNLGERPGGMWGDLEKETLLIHQRQTTNIWREVNDETLIIRPRRDMWRELDSMPVAQNQVPGIWMQVGDETLVLSEAQASAGIWGATTQAGDFTLRQPTRRLGWALKPLQMVSGEAYYVLKNTRSGAYLRLSEPQVFLWNLMDGQHSLRDLAVAYFAEYQSLALEGIVVLLAQLQAKGFLIEAGNDLFANTAQALGGDRLPRLWNWLQRTFLQKTFSLRNVDHLITRLYKAGVFLIFSRPVQVFMMLITISGLVAFGFHAWQGSYSILHGGSGLASGLLGLYAAQFFAILLHEAAHAFTCKHYGRQVRRAGFMIYLGMPAFFVDTSDIWMEPRRPRLLVSWAGPYSGFFLGALSSLLIFAIPNPAIAGWFFQFAFTCILLSFVNLNPLLLWDGYYLLMDWLEMPMLRQRALNFVRRDLWKKISAGESFERDDKIYAVFGLLSLIWTVIAVGASALAMIDFLLGIW